MDKRLKLSVRRPHYLALFVCVMVVIFALAACGGDSGSTSASTASNNSNTSNNSNATSVATVNIKETKGSDGKDVYSCDPLTISIKTGDTVTFTNQSDEIQDFDQGDAQKAGVDFKMNLNQSTTATFKTAGTFAIKSEKGAMITVTVQ